MRSQKHFLIKRMFKQNGGMHYEFSCEAACDASVKYFSCRRATSDATASGVPVFSITSSATAGAAGAWHGGKNMFSMFAADLIAQHGAFDLRLFRHIDDQYAIGPPDRRFSTSKGTTQRR